MSNQDGVTSTVLDGRDEPQSSFHHAFKLAHIANSAQAKAQAIVTIIRFATPLGVLYAGASEQGLCFLDFTDRKMIEHQIQQLEKRMKARFVQGSTPVLDMVKLQVQEYFDRKRQTFDIPLDIDGTPFQIQAWQALQKIPYGETRCYQQQAARIGNTGAVRAVASANAKNHIAIIVPCHRVIAKNGSLAGFGGGIWRKQYLLDLEAGK